MKIAIISVFPPYRGGIAQFNEQLARTLVFQGHEVLKVNFKRQYPNILFPGKSQFVEHAIHATDTPALLDSIAPRSWKKTAKFVLSQEVDLVILPYWSGYLAPALAGVMNHLKDTRVKCLIHNATPHDANPLQKLMNRGFYKRGNNFIALSESVANDLTRLAPHGKVTELFHPIYDHFGAKMDPTDAKRQLNIDPAKKTLLFFGLLRPYKGLDTLLKAFKTLPNDYQLLIAGEAYERTKTYDALITDDIRSRIAWKNEFIPDEEMPMWFSAADALVLPYKSATQSGVTAAALHFDIPIIASNVGGLSEYIEQGKSGMLVERYTEPIAFQRVIEGWFRENKPRTEVSATIAEIKEKLSWPRFAERVVEGVDDM